MNMPRSRRKGRGRRRPYIRRRTVVIRPPRYFPPFPRRRIVIIRPRRSFFLEQFLATTFGIASGIAIGNAITSKDMAMDRYYEAHDEKKKMIECSMLPDHIKFLEGKKGQPECTTLKDGSKICLFEWKKGMEDTCIFPP